MMGAEQIAHALSNARHESDGRRCRSPLADEHAQRGGRVLAEPAAAIRSRDASTRTCADEQFQ
jgi:hypothetical protein